jgi:hypothetical protein
MEKKRSNPDLSRAILKIGLDVLTFVSCSLQGDVVPPLCGTHMISKTCFPGTFFRKVKYFRLLGSLFGKPALK